MPSARSRWLLVAGDAARAGVQLVGQCVRLEDRATGAEFRMVNTHLDHVSQLARGRQARLIVEDAAAYGDDYPQLLTGDMNCDRTNPAITAFRAGGWTDTYAAIHGTEDPGHTFHAFLGPAYASDIGKMDWIFARGRVAVTAAEVISDARDGRFPSDHYFVGATVEIGAPHLRLDRRSKRLSSET